MITFSSRLKPRESSRLAGSSARRLVSVAERRERGVRQTKVARIARVSPADLAGLGREPDKGGNVGVNRPLKMRDDGPSWAGRLGPC